MEDIKRFLEEKRPLIDEAIRRVAPERIDQAFAEWAYGKPRYEYDLESLNRSLSEPIWDLLDRGGKRWRPALFLLILELLGKDPQDYLDYAAIPELVHNGTLMIDDCEDLGELRRGKPCTYKIFGLDVAINTGNYMYFIPLLTVMKGGLDHGTKNRAFEAFLEEMVNVSVGQALDIWWHKGKKEDVTEEQYLQMCAYKTGTLARLSARLAAILAGAPKGTEDLLGRLAESLGVGFQIQDDILSATPGEFTERKGYGDDITEGKRSLLVIHALTNAPQEDRKELLDILGRHTRDRMLIRRALDILERNGSIQYARDFSRRLISEAWEEAAPQLPDNAAKRALESFMRFAIERKI